LQRGAQDRVAAVRPQIDDRAELLHLAGVQQFGIDVVQAVRVDPSRQFAQVVLVVGQVQDAALAEHDVVVQLLAHGFPELEGVLVKGGAFVPQIVRAHDGGVAPGVAAAQPAALEHGDVGDLVFLGEIVGGGEAVPAAADDDHVVGRLGLRRAPGRGPVLMVRERVSQQAENGIAGRHGAPYLTL
jgi:hypothetical protein